MAVRTRTGGGLAARGAWVVWAVAAVVMGWMSAASWAQSGACCSATNTCTLRTQTNCASVGGRWLGPGVMCSAGVCAQGACCVGEACVVSTQTDCGASLGGQWAGTGTTCFANPGPCALGGCCVSGSACMMTRGPECAAAGGVWNGANTSCTPEPCLVAACCTLVGACVLATEADCIALHGGVWQGAAELACEPNLCARRQSCCTTSGCRVLTYRACVAAAGGWLDLECTLSPSGTQLCNFTGACCTGAACTVTTGTQCNGLFRVLQTCGPAGECPVGACCLPSGVCSETSADGCVQQGGYFYGIGAVCAVQDCARVVCCGADSSCTVTTVPLCTSGTIRRDVQSCTPDPCPTGACCATFSGQCAVLSRTDCLKFDATFRGGVCDATLCTASTGACCLPGQLCVITSRDGCVPQYGYTAWLGPATACAPNPCCAVDIDDSGALNVSDLFEFLRLYFSGCP